MYTDPSTGEMKNGVMKVSYRHEECIRILVERPFITQTELAQIFGVTQGWMCQVMSSDAFKARLAEAKLEVHGPAIATAKEKLEAVVSASLDRLLEKLSGPMAMPKDETVLRAVEISTKALGYGARDANAAPSAQFIINLPGKAASEGEWAGRYQKTPGGVVDVEMKEVGTPVPPEKTGEKE